MRRRGKEEKGEKRGRNLQDWNTSFFTSLYFLILFPRGRRMKGSGEGKERKGKGKRKARDLLFLILSLSLREGRKGGGKEGRGGKIEIEKFSALHSPYLHEKEKQ